MNPEEAAAVIDLIDAVGLEVFRDQPDADFPEIADPRFHALREAYIAAADELDHYIREFAG